MVAARERAGVSDSTKRTGSSNSWLNGLKGSSGGGGGASSSAGVAGSSASTGCELGSRRWSNVGVMLEPVVSREEDEENPPHFMKASVKWDWSRVLYACVRWS